MKRIIIALLAAAVLLPSAFAQSGDARAKGLAGAMTAVGDDMNALYYNPAGLAFVRKSYLNVEANADLSFTRGLTAGSSMPWVWESWENGQTSYVYSDGFTNLQKPFDFEQYKAAIMDFAESAGAPVVWETMTDRDKYTYYSKLCNARSAYDGMNQVNPIKGNPRAIVGGPHWGLSAFGEYELIPDFVNGFKGYSTQMQYDVYRRMGAMAGVGFALGPVAIGANVKYVTTAYYSKSFDFADFMVGPPSLADLQDLFNYKPDPASEVKSIEVGFGALLTLGVFNAAVYNDNVMPFLGKTEKVDYVESFMKTMNFGLSWMPSDNKFSKTRFPLVLMATLDLKNFGDEENRQLCAGLETGLNAGDFLEALARVGYTQPLPGTLEDMASSFDPMLGTVSMGMTAKLWFAKIDGAFSVPTQTISDMSYGSAKLSDAERLEPFGTLSITFAFAF